MGTTGYYNNIAFLIYLYSSPPDTSNTEILHGFNIMTIYYYYYIYQIVLDILLTTVWPVLFQSLQPIEPLYSTRIQYTL